MSTRTTLILLALLVLVGSIVYLIEYRKPAGAAGTPVPAENQSLLEVTFPAISGVTVRDVMSGTHMSATRDISGTWWLADQPADPATLNQFASQLAFITVQRVFTPTGDLGQYGLASPRYSVEISTDAGQQSFGVGDAAPSGASFYANKPGDPRVYLIDGGLVGQLKELAAKPPVAAPPAPAPLTVPTPAAP
jgi:hypothetical protein